MKNTKKKQAAPFPAELLKQKRWVCWRWQEERKVPCLLATSGHINNAKVNSPRTWRTHEECMAMVRAKPDVLMGVGIMFNGDGLCGLDLDWKHSPKTELQDRVQKDFSGSYEEPSPSGLGIHTLIRADMSRWPRNPNGTLSSIKKDDLGVELYATRRWFTVTFDSAAPKILDRTEQALALFAELNPLRPKRETTTISARPDAEFLREALTFIDPDIEYNPWVEIGMGLHDWDEAEGLDIWETWSSEAYVKYTPGACESKWQSFHAGGGKTIGTLLDLASKNGFPFKLDATKEFDAVVADTTPTGNVTALPSREPYSHAALATDFMRQHGERVRYVAAIGRWLLWDGTRWQRDDARNVLALFDRIAQSYAERCQFDTALGKPGSRARMARSMESAAYRQGGEILAKVQPALTIPLDALDRDPCLLNTPSGVIDLRTGDVLPHDPAMMITKCTNVALGDPARPRFDRFIHEITCGDVELAAYLRRALGACCFGANAHEGDHWLLFLHGLGRNGKNTLLDLVLWALGDYAKQIPAQVLMADERGNRHLTEIANLLGLRLAVSSEISEGSRWAENQIKSLTGDATLSARFMRQDLFEFARTHRHIVLGNHRPLLANPDPAIAERLHLVPFNASFIGRKADTRLPKKLKGESAGVLAWLIAGAKIYYAEERLTKCPVVESATQEYLDSQATFDQWIDEYCIRQQDARTPAGELYRSFRLWKEDRGEGVLSQTRWGEEMARRFPRVRSGSGNYYEHVALRVRGFDDDGSGLAGVKNEAGNPYTTLQLCRAV